MTNREIPTVIIIGAGFGGISTVLELQRRGLLRILLLERAAGPGGVWQANQYPGARCDNPSALYSLARHRFSWSGRYGDRAEIQRYLAEVVGNAGLEHCIRYGQTVTSARFRAETADWAVQTATGEQFHADYLISAVGQLAEPCQPNIVGYERFRGVQFHSARWPDSLDVSGLRVGVIGTGASAAQVVPWLQRNAATLTVLQRNAAWVLPKSDVRYSTRRAALAAWPPIRAAERTVVYALCELLILAVTSAPTGSRWVTRMAHDHLRRSISDTALRESLSPDYPLGGKRCVFSDEFYPALAAPNCTVVTDRISTITESGIMTEAGDQLDLDMIVYCTGFTATDFLSTIDVSGRDGKSLAEQWAPSAKTYLGMATSDFPNLFFVAGPNTNLTFGSVVSMLECQARYIASLLSWASRNRVGLIEVRPEAETAFDGWLRDRFAGSVWARVASPYKDEHGTVSSLWPRTMTRYRWMTRRPRLTHFRMSRLPS
ncbi:flavin-containing monooxygenase [Nocardia fluminea]|uniref:Cation diffusion facilitator CzcD-associated flavoprotein CzcO n=1 Tax=Nocardia fluminea TaxID=134984 RepID=A0A2N3V9J8_9NOCA|nr:NAD(P)/FAD-dependent oxidoreductase [Nocardia fluminea]PKV78266.1 cation diffusion facilitator CzcD-associated flavoprotein CzcO [Nocardia fluminea]